MRFHNPPLVLWSVGLAAVLGLVLAREIPNSIFPAIAFNRAVVLVDSEDLPPEQMLVTVTRPLEEAAYAVVGTRLVRSTTTRGSAQIDVSFIERADPTASFQLLNAALGQVRARLPRGTRVESWLLTAGAYEIIDLSLTSKVRSLAGLTDVAFYDLVPGFHRIPGVYRVQTVGGKQRQYMVRLDPARMLAHRLSPLDVVAALRKANVIASAGRVFDAHRMLLTVVTSPLQGAEELARVVVARIDGQPVEVRDIGAVELAIREDYIRVEAERGPAVVVGVSRQPGGSTVLIAREVHRLVEEFRRRFPDVHFSFPYDQAALVQSSFRSVRDAIVLGTVLAVAVVFVFTLSWRSALAAAVVVPSTLAITFVVMRAAGQTFNMMTLGGLAAGIGLFIDDAIVMIEALERLRGGGCDAAEAGRQAVARLWRPLVASTLTVIVVFVPMAFLSGATGMLFRALAVTLGSGLAISLVLALFFTPALEEVLGRGRKAVHQPGRAFAALRAAYLATLRPLMRFPVLALALGAICLVSAYMMYRRAGTDYLPAFDEGGFVLDYITPAPSTMADTQALLRSIEAILRRTPEVSTFVRRTGTQLGFWLTESNRGDITVRLKSRRARSTDQVIDALRARILATVPGVHIEFSQILQDLIGDLSGTPEPIEVKVFGSDQGEIEASARQIAAVMRKLPGLVDVFDGLVMSMPEEEIVVDDIAAERYGFSPDDVWATLRSVVEGTVATQVRVGDRLLDVRVRYPRVYHQDLHLLSEVILKAPDGGLVPLEQMARFRWLGEQAELDRERLRALVRVTARLSGTDMGSAARRVRAALARTALPAGVRLEYGGLYAQQRRAFKQLGLVLGASLAGMLLILLAEFAALAPALAVLLGALCCVAGSMAALALSAVTLNIASFMGVIMVVDITAKNGILLLDQAEHALAQGQEPTRALAEAASARLRPILMTTLATAAGLFPLALGLGAGAQIQQPLAIAVIGGLALAMMLSSGLTGGIYLLGRRRRRGGQEA